MMCREERAAATVGKMLGYRISDQAEGPRFIV